MEQLTQLGVAGVIVYLFLDKMFAYLNAREAKSAKDERDPRESELERSHEREREMGALIERVDNLSSLQKVVSESQSRLAELAAGFNAMSSLIATELTDIKRRLERIENRPTVE